MELKNQTELRTINVRLEEWREEEEPADDEDISHDGKGSSWSPIQSTYLAWTHVSFMMFAFVTLAYSLVWAIPCIGIYLVGVVFSRW